MAHKRHLAISLRTKRSAAGTRLWFDYIRPKQECGGNLRLLCSPRQHLGFAHLHLKTVCLKKLFVLNLLYDKTDFKTVFDVF